MVDRTIRPDDEVSKKYSIMAMQGATLEGVDVSTRDKILKLLEKVESARERA